MKALEHPIWKAHEISNTYIMDGSEGWKIAYYYILTEDGEPRVLVEKPAVFKGVKGTDFREVPIHYLTPINR